MSGVANTVYSGNNSMTSPTSEEATNSLTKALACPLLIKQSLPYSDVYNDHSSSFKISNDLKLTG